MQLARRATPDRCARMSPGPAERFARRRFGRGPVREFAAPAIAQGASDDLKLFATTFLAGFIFVSVFLA